MIALTPKAARGRVAGAMESCDAQAIVTTIDTRGHGGRRMPERVNPEAGRLRDHREERSLPGRPETACRDQPGCRTAEDGAAHAWSTGQGSCGHRRRQRYRIQEGVDGSNRKGIASPMPRWPG